MATANRKPYTGIVFFSAGFRPFFLGAGLFALIAIPLWMLIYSGNISLPSPFPATDWHIHEMLFGYTAAVITGFLFTAIPNWTGRMPIRGWPLAGLALLWLAGRLAMSGVLGLGPIAVMLIDVGFMVAIAVAIAVEIIAGRNWRNLIVLAPVTLFSIANIVFHLEVMTTGSSDYGRRLAFAVVIFLIMLIGGRIIPSFTRNWLAKRGEGAMPTPFNTYDKFCLLAAVIGMGLWVALPEAGVSRAALGLAAALHLARVPRWQGIRAAHSFLLVMLHLAYLFIPAGLAALAFGAQSIGFHLLGAGAIGGMTLAVMMRATLGHSGRALEAGLAISAIFIALVLAALSRAFLPAIELSGLSGLWLAAGFWMLAYGGFVLVIGPMLLRPKAAPKRANKVRG
jgi:uncharacterized protein involved in response to NO